MANVFIDENVLISVADAIRAKTGSTDKIYPKDFSATIENISGSSEDVRYVTFMNGDAVLYVKPVAVGDDCVDVLAKGLIETPTKESTAQYNYAYSGWSLTDGGSADTANALANVTEDRTVYAAYTESVRYYTVSFYDGETLVETLEVTYGSTAKPTYEKTGYILVAWSPSNENITEDTNCYGEWIVDDGYIHDDWDVIAARCDDGTATDYYKLGAKITVPIALDSGMVEVDFEIVDTTSKVSGTTFAFLATIALDNPIVFCDYSYQKKAYYAYSTLAPYLENDIKPYLPEKLKSALKSVAMPNASKQQSLHIPTSQFLFGKGYGDTVSKSSMFEAFANDDSKTMIRKTSDGTAVEYWTASTYNDFGSYYPTYVTANANLSYTTSPSSSTKHIVLLFFV
ncbi:MAG: hypothetical protein IJ370_04050 [Oscillospiraceae bacterium]|nr:hypothetical protein [Oscillospiraceae bacterium]MBQ8338542.1 hypothetical protein [Oscillospiraceae bacterium]